MGQPDRAIVQAIAEAIWEKKGFDVTAYAVSEVLDYTDFMVIASAGSDRQTLAIAESVEDVMRERFGEKPQGREGRSNARWVLLDFSDVVVHVFHRPVRDYYELDRLYQDTERIELEEPVWVQNSNDPVSEVASLTDYDDEPWEADDSWDDELADEADETVDGDSGSQS